MAGSGLRHPNVDPRADEGSWRRLVSLGVSYHCLRSEHTYEKQHTGKMVAADRDGHLLFAMSCCNMVGVSRDRCPIAMGADSRVNCFCAGCIAYRCTMVLAQPRQGLTSSDAFQNPVGSGRRYESFSIFARKKDSLPRPLHGKYSFEMRSSLSIRTRWTPKTSRMSYVLLSKASWPLSLGLRLIAEARTEPFCPIGALDDAACKFVSKNSLHPSALFSW